MGRGAGAVPAPLRLVSHGTVTKGLAVGAIRRAEEHNRIGPPTKIVTVGDAGQAPVRPTASTPQMGVEAPRITTFRNRSPHPTDVIGHGEDHIRPPTA